MNFMADRSATQAIHAARGASASPPHRRRPLLWLRVLIVCLLAGRLAAVTVHWTPTRAVDLPLLPSTVTSVHTRTVILPGGPVTQVPRFWTDDDLFVQTVDNSLVIQLRNPDFAGTVTAYDAKGNVFLLHVRCADEAEDIDSVVLLRPIAEGDGPAAARARAQTDSNTTDTDAAVTEMMRHMLGGAPAPHITGAVVTRVEDDAVRVGRRVFEDSDLAIWMVRVYQGPAVRGCELLFRFHGPKPVRLEMERLFFPGALAVYASDQVLLDPAHPRVELAPQQTIRVYYVYKD